jgi:hypothetical protein
MNELDKTTDGEDLRLVEAAWDVVEAGHRVLLDRIDILILEIRQAVVAAERQAVLCLLAVLLFATAWMALNGVAVLAMRAHVSWVAAGGLAAAINAVLAVGILFWAWKDRA